MGSIIDEIRRKVREKHRQKKELERQQREEESRKQAELLADRNRQQQESRPTSWKEAPRKHDSNGWVPVKQDNFTETRKRVDKDNGTTRFLAGGGAIRSSSSLGVNTRDERDNSIGSSSHIKSVSFVRKPFATSPLSDFACSQSPTKAVARSVTYPEGTKRAAVDAFEKARQLFEKEKKAPEKDLEDIAAAGRGSLLAKENMPKAKEDKPRAVEEELARRSSSSLPYAVASKRLTIPPLPRLRHISEWLDPVEVSRRLERKRLEAKAREQAEEAKAKFVRNPIALMERDEHRHYSSREATIQPVKKADSALLWDDSEVDEPKDEEKQENEKKKRKSKVASSTTKKKGGEGATKKSSEVRKSDEKRKSSGAQYSDDESNDEFDEEFENALIPTFENPKLGPPSALEPFKLSNDDDESETHEVPASINRYLMPYQREGVAFMYSCVVVRGTGSLLGDDMGLGKTVQVISLLASILKKTGTGKDAVELKRRRRLIAEKMRKMNAVREEAWLCNVGALASADNIKVDGLALPGFAPILVIVPPSLVGNWMNEFRAWGHFGVGSYQEDRSHALHRVRDGINEILLCGKALFINNFEEINTIRWRLVIVDEIHSYKNDKGKGFVALAKLRDTSECPVIGMTGTLMQNNHNELYNLIDLIQPGFLGEEQFFKENFSKPILFGRTKTAAEDTIQRSKACTNVLSNQLDQIYIKRTKESELADELPEKVELILFCSPTEIQKRLYQYLLTLPDFELLRYGQAACDCGVNRSIFVGYKNLHTHKERVEYMRRHRKDTVKRCECCYRSPVNPFRDEEGQPHIHPLSAIWKAQHEDGMECQNCPYCILFPAMSKLVKLSNHAALLQSEKDPATLDVGTEAWNTAIRDVEFAKVAIPQEILAELGGSYVIQDGIMTDHSKLSGKMQKLELLLEMFSEGNNRVLLFSHWIKTLDLIEQFVKVRGYTFLRLDGSTKTSLRQSLVDKFQNNKMIFLFLISSKAGGLGLNLTAANKVIQFDMDYNPSHDEQAQDRAFRIGQNQDVQVVRLVAQGTIEELKYIRQIYKVQLRQETIVDSKGEQHTEAARMFRGVQGDKNRKGELFGVENLLKFKDGSFLSDLWKASDKQQSKKSKGIEMVSAEDLTNRLSTVTEEEVNDLADCYQEAFEKAAGAQQRGTQDIRTVLSGQTAVNHQDFLRPDRGEAKLKRGDEGFDEEVGGESQMIMACFDRGDVNDDIVDADTVVESDVEEPERSSPAVADGALDDALRGEISINHRDMLFADRGEAALKPGVEGFDEEVGGASQNFMYVLDRDVEEGDQVESVLSMTALANKVDSEATSIVASPVRVDDVVRSVSSMARLPSIQESSDGKAKVKSTVTSEYDALAMSKPVPKRSKKRAAPDNEKKTKTTFSSLDISVPSYRKTKRKK